MERVLPKTIDYTDVLPLAVESKARRRTFFPTNGQSFTDNTNNIVRIDISADALLDTQHSYLRFTNTFAANAAGVDFAGGHSFIRRLRVEQSGTILEDIQNYNKLMGGIVLPCQTGWDYLAERSITEAIQGRGSSQSGTVANFITPGAINVTAAGVGAADALGLESAAMVACNANNVDNQFAAGGSYDFCIPLTSGLFNNEKLIPLMLMSAPLTIEIELAPHVQAVCAQGAGTYTWSNVRYIANLVEVGQDVAQQLRMVQEMSGGVLTLAGQTYRHFSGNVAAASNETVINIPARVKSMKSLFFFSIGGGADANATYDVGGGVSMNLQEYQLKIGSVVYPPTPVQCAHRGGVAVAAAGSQRAEQLMELAKAWGNVGSTKGLGMLTSLNYNVAAGDAAAAGRAAGAVGGGLSCIGDGYRFCPYGLDLEAFQRVAIESGVNTADRSLPISLILSHANPGGAAVVAQTVDAYVLADALFYINADGSMSVSV
jgi:hypothetical protein